MRPVPDKLPPVVRAATTLTVAAAVWTIVESVSALRNVGSTETVSRLNSGLNYWGNPGHLSITTLQEVLRVSANASALLAAATGVLAVFAAKGSRQSRVGLAVLAVPAVLASLMANAPAGVLMMVGIGLLWSRNARPWFAAIPTSDPRSDIPRTPAVTTPAVTELMLPAGAPTPPLVAVATGRPPRVTAAAVVAIVLSALAAIGGLLGGIGLAELQSRADLRQTVIDRMRAQQVSLSLADLDRYLPTATVVAAVVAVLGLLGVLAGILVLRGSPRARIALIVLSAICALISLIAITSIISLIWLVGALFVIFGLGAIDSAAWFKRR